MKTDRQQKQQKGKHELSKLSKKRDSCQVVKNFVKKDVASGIDSDSDVESNVILPNLSTLKMFSQNTTSSR